MSALGSRTFIFGAVFLSAILTGMSIVYPPLWWMVFLGPIPFLYVLLSGSAHSRKGALAGITYGFFFNAVVAASAWSVHPLDWVGITDPALSFLIIGAALAGSSLSMSLGMAVFALLLFELRTRNQNFFITALSAGIFWVSAEWLQAAVSSVFMLGATSTVNVHFTLASIGYGLGNASSEFWISLARWGSVPLLSFSAATFAACAAYSFAAYADRKKYKMHALGAGAVFCAFLLSSAGAGAVAERARGTSTAWGDQDSVTIAAAYTNFTAKLLQSTEDMEARTEVVYEIAQELRLSAISPDALILPEGVGLEIDNEKYRAIEALVPKETLIIHGKYDPTLNSSGIVQIRSHAAGGETYVTDKRFIMPYGEYPPYHFSVPLRLFAPAVHRDVMMNRGYSGGKTLEIGSAAGVPIGARACSEIFSPQLYAELADDKHAGILTHSVSVALFHGSKVIQNQMRSAARIRAVENRIPIVQAVNAGTGSAFDCRGKELTPIAETERYKVYSLSRASACTGTGKGIFSFFRL